MANKPNCTTCKYKIMQINANKSVSAPDDAHCYMFEKEPKGCMQWIEAKPKPINLISDAILGSVIGIDNDFSDVFAEIFGGK